ncbi:hypothetical protein [Streptomyces sp. NPDC090080]|uniref:hypothetical protein n=1 Tax=Streptomyces sp. NPDC090080 TaxID=3365939 RepID=UPI00382569F4
MNWMLCTGGSCTGSRGLRQRPRRPRALIAVSAASNRSKADKDPTDWLPPFTPFWCEYVTNWIADKIRYQLSVDPAEQTALTERLAACPDRPITVILAH